MEVIIGRRIEGQRRLIFEFSERGTNAKIRVFIEEENGKREMIATLTVREILNLARIFQ